MEDIPIYETDYEVNEILNKEIQKVFEAGEIDAVTFTSASTVRGFVNGIKNVDYTKICAICIGEQTAAEARKYGMQISIERGFHGQHDGTDYGEIWKQGRRVRLA